MGNYNEYIADIEIARDILADSNLLPEEEDILCDLYALPSHNFQTYYAIVYAVNNDYCMVYAKPQILKKDRQVSINMYSFSATKDVDSDSQTEGRITMGRVKLKGTAKEYLIDIIENLPDEKLQEKSVAIDGEFQAVRVFSKGNVVKEVVYTTDDFISFPIGKEYLSGGNGQVICLCWRINWP